MSAIPRKHVEISGRDYGVCLKGHHIGYPGQMLNYATTSVTHAMVSCIHELAMHRETIGKNLSHGRPQGC